MDISNNSDDQQKLASRNYIKWDDPSVEKKSEGEDEDIQAVADQINAIQKAQYNCHRHCYSGIHKEGSFPVADLANSFRHACSNARYCEGHSRRREEPPQTSEAEHVRGREGVACAVPVQQ
jgi:hypothetical protein